MNKFTGISLLDAETIKTLKAIQNKYRIDYKRFFITLVDSYKGTNATKEVKLASDTVSIISSIVNQIDVLLKTPDKMESKKKSEDIFKLIDEVNENFKFFNEGQNLSNAMEDRVRKTELQTGITTEQIKRTSEIIKGRSKKIFTKPLIPKGLDTTLLKVWKTSEPLLNLLGPFANIGKAISSTLGGVIESQRTKSKLKAKEQFTGAVFPKLEGEKEESVLEQYKDLYGTGRGKIEETIFGKTTLGGINPFGKFKSEQPFKYSGTQVSKEAKTTFNDSLFQFFSGPAYKAKWTSELLEAIKPKSTGQFDVKEKVSGGKSFIGKTLDSLTSWALGLIPKILPILLPTLGILGAAAVGAIAGKFLGEIKIGDKTINKHIEGGFTNVFETGNKINRFRERQGLEPVTKRALELQEKGIPVMESIKQARLELKKDNATKVENVPIVSKEGVLVAEQQKQNKEMLKYLGIISENSKKQDSGQVMQTNGKETYNLRNPLLEAMNSGLVDLR